MQRLSGNWTAAEKCLRSLLALCLCGILLVCLGGCAGNLFGASGSSGDATEKMIAYLDNKYDDTFTYSEPFGGGIGATTKQIYVKSKKFPKANVWAEYSDEDGKEVFSDNYVSVKYEDNVRSLLQHMLNSVAGCDVLLWYDIGSKGWPNHFTDKTTLSEYISSVDAGIGFVAVVPDTYVLDKEKFDARLLQAAQGEKIEIRGGTVYFAQTADQYTDPDSLSTRELDSIPQLVFSTSTNSSADPVFEWK